MSYKKIGFLISVSVWIITSAIALLVYLPPVISGRIPAGEAFIGSVVLGLGYAVGSIIVFVMRLYAQRFFP